MPKVLLISPAIIEEIREDFRGGKKKSKKLGGLYKQIASEHNLLFLDLSKIVRISEKDGIHLDSEAHEVIGKEISDIVENIF